MLILLSPSKTQDIETQSPTDIFSEPHFEEERWLLKKQLEKFSLKEYMDRMNVSSKLASENIERISHWSKRHSDKNSKQAIHVFTGSVYDAFQNKNFTKRQYAYMQQHLRILSGLYGVLRPLDLIQPYRLEMASKVSISLKKHSYISVTHFWKYVLADYFKKQKHSNLIINLASLEYTKAVDKTAFSPRWISIEFLQKTGKEKKQVTLYSKQERGAMAVWMIENHTQSLEELQKYNNNGYRYMPSVSKNDTLVFVRNHPKK